MSIIRQSGHPLIVVALVGGIAGYMLRGDDSHLESRASAAQRKLAAQEKADESAAAPGIRNDVQQQAAVGTVSPRDMYFPGTEELKPNEMRIVACGTGMPAQRRSQAATCWLVELGNGDKFVFDIGTGSTANLGSLNIPYDFLDKVFVSHLHADHVGDLDALWVGGWTGGRHGGLHVWGPSGQTPELGTKHFVEHTKEAYHWDYTGRLGVIPTRGGELVVHEIDEGRFDVSDVLDPLIRDFKEKNNLK